MIDKWKDFIMDLHRKVHKTIDYIDLDYLTRVFFHENTEFSLKNAILLGFPFKEIVEF